LKRNHTRVYLVRGAQAASLLASAACRDPVGLHKNHHARILPASCRQVQAGSLRSPS